MGRGTPGAVPKRRGHSLEAARGSGVVVPLKTNGPPPLSPARATNPRTGGHRPKKRPLTAGISVGYFVTWQASSSTPHWCPSRCRRTWYDGWWSTTASMSRCSRSWYAYGGGLLGIVTFSVLRSFFCLSSSTACRSLVCWRGRHFLVSGERCL